MRVLLIVPKQNRISGNWITASRFQQGLEKQGHQVIIQETSLYPQGALREKARVFCPDVVLLLHAYRSGRPWVAEAGDMGIPYAVLLTGTDINYSLNDPEESRFVGSALIRSAAVLVQNPLIISELQDRRPELFGNLRTLSPGVVLGEAPYELRAAHKLAKDLPLFLCPAGLRPVKGALPLLEMFDQVASERSDFQVVFCGPQIDAEYSGHFLAAVAQRPWSRYLGAIPAKAMASVMREADILLNNSQSEGLSNALIEAAVIGLPILARNIPGNAMVVRHNINGLLYDSEAEFKRYVLQMLDRGCRRRLSCPDANGYNPDQEATELAAILMEVARIRVHC